MRTKNVNVVIGAGYGDEGKGLMVDYFASKAKGRVGVVRFNGTCQAGHTVTTPEGFREVFHHISSGTFTGAETVMYGDFVAHPFLFRQEHSEYCENYGTIPQMQIDPNCRIATPYDMRINQLLETQRGEGRHGSCGVGFGQTIDRHTKAMIPQHTIFARDLYGNPKDLFDKINSIRLGYYPRRLKELGLTDPLSVMESHNLIIDFASSCKYFSDEVDLMDGTIFDRHDHLIFEGAQGLLLDEEYGTMPYCTPSQCGANNIGRTLNRFGGTADVTYVTRAYATRHGAGPLPHEHEEDFACELDIVDNTNVPNEFQGYLRVAPLEVDLLNVLIYRDTKHLESRHNVNIALTCMDQMGKLVQYARYDMIETVARLGYPTVIGAKYVSHGPTRDDVDQIID